MIHVIFTLDYEIHGNGQGSPYDLMIRPTWKILRQFDKYGAKLTILAEVVEILKFREYCQQHNQDHYHYNDIAQQLKRAVATGHDVQLHLHPSYMEAEYTNNHWQQNQNEYDLASLPYPRIYELIRIGKEFLEELLVPVKSDYVCNVFRAGNWSMQPSKDVVRALTENGFTIDTSVFKYGRREGLVNFDYSHTPSDLVPWRVGERDICRHDPDGKLHEIPIYSEQRLIVAFLSFNRLYRALQTWAHRTRPESTEKDGNMRSGNKLARRLHVLFGRHAWKADFNQCAGRQLINALTRAEQKYGDSNVDLPFVLIGHSKHFTRLNELTVEPFLRFVWSHPDRFTFGRFADIDVTNFY